MQADAAEIAADHAPAALEKRRLLTVRHLDGRTRARKRADKLVALFEREAGGTITPTMRIAIERAAALVVLSEDVSARRLSGDMRISVDDVVRIDHAAERALRRIGIGPKLAEKRPPKTLAEYVAEKRAREGAASKSDPSATADSLGGIP